MERQYDSLCSYLNAMINAECENSNPNNKSLPEYESVTISRMDVPSLANIIGGFYAGKGYTLSGTNFLPPDDSGGSGPVLHWLVEYQGLDSIISLAMTSRGKEVQILASKTDYKEH
jgi:hypothetical protein